QQHRARLPFELFRQGRQQPGIFQRRPADLVDADGQAAFPRRHGLLRLHLCPAGKPAASGRPSARFRFWIACPAAPLTRLSGAEKRTTRPGAAAWTEIQQSLVNTTSESRGGPASSTRTKAAPA